MKRKRVAFAVEALGLVACSALVFLAGPASAAGANGKRPERKVGAEIIFPNHHDVSPPLRDIEPIEPDWSELTGEKNEHPVLPLPHHHQNADLQLVKDPALQSAPQPNLSATAGLSFDGIGLPGYSPSSAPPDTNGAAGATQYVQWVNTAFAVYDKTTGALVYGPANGNTLFTGFGDRCATDNSGDPIVMYDKAANRWVMMQFAVSAQPFLQCVAVSQTSDATGAWNRYSFSFGNQFNDYPKGGVWPDGYYVTYNMFNAALDDFLGTRVCAMDRDKMINGQTATQQCFSTNDHFGGLLPADLDGATPPPAGSPNYLLAFDDLLLNGLNLWKFHVDWATPARSTFTGPTKINTASFFEACGGGTCIPQAGTSQKLDSLADRLMFRLAYRNFGGFQSLVVNHSVTSGTVVGVRWYEVRNPGGTPSVAQQGTFQPDGTYRWMGSIAQDKQGNMMMGYSASSSSLKPGVRVTGRLASDPVNTMQTESTVIAGAGAQTTIKRWGDYSSMTIDPSDDCTFWYTTEYIKADGGFNWSTRIASFKFPGCVGPPTPDFSLSASPSTLTLTLGTGGTSTITVSSVNGFNSAVALIASGLPSGVTASFSPDSVTPPANGSGDSTLTLTASGTATTGTSTVTVTGTAGSTTRTTELSLTVTGCTYLIAPTSATVGSAGRTDTVSVTASGGCPWTASSQADWITVVSGASGSGNGTVGYSVASNPSSEGRTGTIVIASRTFTIVQGGVACTYSISPSSASVDFAGGSGTVQVTAPPACPWTSASQAAWLSVSGTGNGPGSASYTVAANPGPPRTGTLTIAGQTFTVTQAADPCPFVITPATAAFTSASGVANFNVTTPVGCVWEATSNVPWVVPTLGRFGSGSATVQYNVQANPGGAREGRISVGSGSLRVTQDRNPVQRNVDRPQDGQTLTQPFDIAGWAIDLRASSGTGVDTLHNYALPLAGGPAIFLGVSAYGGARPDVGALFGAQFTNSAFGLPVRGLPPGQYQIHVFPHSSVTGAFENPQVRTITAQANPGGSVDVPAANATVPLTFVVAGWAFDRAAASGSGIDAIHIWAYPGGTASGAAPVFLGATTTTTDRPDVVAAFQDPQIIRCGYGAVVTVPAPGLYDVVVYARSALTGQFSPYVKRVTAQ